MSCCAFLSYGQYDHIKDIPGPINIYIFFLGAYKNDLQIVIHIRGLFTCYYIIIYLFVETMIISKPSALFYTCVCVMGNLNGTPNSHQTMQKQSCSTEIR